MRLPCYPTKQILVNAGLEAAVIAGKILRQDDPNNGFDAQSGAYVDTLKAGIIDPTKVARLAIQGAASIVGLLITTEAMVAEKVETDPQATASGGIGLGGT